MAKVNEAESERKRMARHAQYLARRRWAKPETVKVAIQAPPRRRCKFPKYCH